MKRRAPWWCGALLVPGCVHEPETNDGGIGLPPVLDSAGSDESDSGSTGQAESTGVDESGDASGSSTGEPEPPPPSCTNGLLDGDESDVDCGGGCDPCQTGQACGASSECWTGVCEAGACGVAFSCLEIKQGRPSAQSETYTIYPDGGAQAIDVWCDMESHGGGWTLTFASDGTSFDVAHAVPVPMPGDVPQLFANTDARYQQYAAHDEEMFVCTTGLGETPVYETRTFELAPRFWDQTLDNAEIFLTGTFGTSNASATEYCAGLVWGGCNLDHYGYAIFQSAFGSAHWGRWSANTYYGPTGAELRCFSNDDVQGSTDAWLWHFVR
jgi:hypothetical protein